MVILKTAAEIEVMTEAGRRLAQILEVLVGETKTGVTTKFLDERSEAMIRSAGATPAFLGYKPTGARKAYPATLCVSVNDVVVHGTPSDYVIRDGDLVKLDLGLVFHGLYVDAAVTVPVGNVTAEAKKLVRTTAEALAAGIKAAQPGNTLGDIGYAIERVVAKTSFSIVQSLTGHGIGRKLHEDPYVFNTGKPGHGEKLEVGMALALEPMVAVGSGKVKQIHDDGYATVDRSLAAHFEHTVVITKDGPRVLTRI